MLSLRAAPRALLRCWAVRCRMSSASEGSDKSDRHVEPQRTTDPDKLARKAATKAKKAERRAIREGRADPDYGRKKCDLCQGLKDLLIRMVCGKCWREVSGGVVDGDDDHPDYRYGGLWKNLHKQQ